MSTNSLIVVILVFVHLKCAYLRELEPKNIEHITNELKKRGLSEFYASYLSRENCRSYGLDPDNVTPDLIPKAKAKLEWMGVDTEDMEEIFVKTSGDSQRKVNGTSVNQTEPGQTPKPETKKRKFLIDRKEGINLGENLGDNLLPVGCFLSGALEEIIAGDDPFTKLLSSAIKTEQVIKCKKMQDQVPFGLLNW